MTTDDDNNNNPESRPAGTEEREPRVLTLRWSRDGRTFDARTGLAWSKTSTRAQETTE